MNQKYVLIYSGSLISVILLCNSLKKQKISPIIKDISESARLAGFGVIFPQNQEFFVHPDELNKSIQLLKESF